MSRESLYLSESLDIFHETVDGWLYADWKGYQSVDMVMAGCEQMLRLLRERRLARVLNDHTHVAGIWVGAAEWVAQDWFPRMREAGLRCFAWVHSPYQLSRISTNTVVQQAEPGTAVLFEDIEAARAWLAKQP